MSSQEATAENGEVLHPIEVARNALREAIEIEGSRWSEALQRIVESLPPRDAIRRAAAEQDDLDLADASTLASEDLDRKDTPVSVALTPEQAFFVADLNIVRLLGELDEIRSDVSNAYGESTGPESVRAAIASMRETARIFEDEFDELAWGEPETEITVTMPRSQLRWFATQLLMEDPGLSSLAELRKRARFVDAGAAIFDQLDAAL